MFGSKLLTLCITTQTLFMSCSTGSSIPWDVVIQTCTADGSGTDAAAYLKIYYARENADETFLLDNPSKNDFERGARDHFKVLLNTSDIVNVGLYWWPSLSLNQHWCVEWVILLNSDQEICYLARFDKWILHYRSPPTYPESFTQTHYVDCISPRPKEA